jgi:tRNA threonylcarbamoyladenosine biosynthesis protein TsaB
MLLAIDTSTEWIGICLFDGVQVVSEQILCNNKHQTIELVPAIDRLLNQNSISFSEVTGLGIALGPGSFTGLRIGMSVVKGIALALSIPVAGIPSLDILASGQPPMDVPLLVFLHLGRNRMASQRYVFKHGKWMKEEDLLVGDIHTIEKTIESPIYVSGEMNLKQRQILGRKWKTVTLASPSNCVRRPAVLAELAWEKIESGSLEDINNLSPIYVHTLSDVPEL